MSTTKSRSSGNAAGDLTPVLSARWALTWKHFGVCLLFGGLFVYLNHLPVADGSIRLHLDRGEQAVRQFLPRTADVSGPAAVDDELVNTCWLSQMAYAVGYRWGGARYVSHLFALTAFAYLLTLGRVFYLQTRRVGLMALGVAMAAILGSRHPITPRPAVFGAACFAALLWIVTRLEERSCEAWPAEHRQTPVPWRGNWASWLALAGLFVAWANLHASFLLGIAVLGCYAVGRIVAVGWRTRRASRIIADRLTQR